MKIWGSVNLAMLLCVSLPSAAANEVSNPDFDTDTTGWEDPFPDPNTEISWSAVENFSGAPGSGSLELRNSIDNGAADGPIQCIPGSPGAYHAEARALIPSAQSLVPIATLLLVYYATTDCSSFLDRDEAAVTITDSWELAEIEGVAPGGTQSIGVRLLSGNTVELTFTTMYWDAIFVPEPGRSLAFYAALATCVALAIRARRSPRSQPSPHG